MRETELVDAIEPGDTSGYRHKVLRTLHSSWMIEYQSQDHCLILPPGVHYVEGHYAEWLDKLNKRS